MSLLAKDVMQRDPRTVGPEDRIADVEGAFLAERVSGFPVVEGNRLVGIVSRSDVVRALCVERAEAEQLSDFYTDLSGFAPPEKNSFARIAEQLGVRLEEMRVSDAMSRHLVCVDADESLDEVARILVERRIHRVPVTSGRRLVGILTSLDFARLVAEGRAKLL